MSNLQGHMAEQDAITAQCDAGACGHPECHDLRAAQRIAQITQIAEVLAKDQWTNSHKGARLLFALITLYCEEDPRVAICEALTDIRHACDLARLHYSREDNIAHELYTEQVWNERKTAKADS